MLSSQVDLVLIQKIQAASHLDVTPMSSFLGISLFEEKIMHIYIPLPELRGIDKCHTQFYVTILSKIFEHWMNKLSYYQPTTEFMGTPTASRILSFQHDFNDS